MIQRKHYSLLPLLLFSLALISIGCTASEPDNSTIDASAPKSAAPSDSPTKQATTIKADIWADNWFALYQEDELIKEDSTAFFTERSFNTESFEFTTSLPAQMSIIMKDYYENDTGLEYIGSRRQQMGDGGFVGQFFNAESGSLLAVSSQDWRCKVIHRAPLNKSCDRDDNPEDTCQSEITAEPANWRSNDFDDSAWSNAVVHSAQAVRPHGGYRDANWHEDINIIWAEDLEVDNVILCRFTIPAP